MASDGSVIIDAKLDDSGLDSGLSGIKGKLDSVGQSMEQTGKKLTQSVTLPVLALGTLGVKSFATFDDSMRKVEATMGDKLGGSAQEAKANITQLRDEAQRLGATTRYSADEAAAGMEKLALAGWDTNQIMQATEPMLSLAAAANMDLATAADIVTDTMSAYGMEADKAAAVTDVFAKASSSTNTDVDMLGQAMKYAGASANAAGMDLEQTVAILGTLADAGIKGSMGGTVLNAMLRDVKKSAEDGAVAIGDTSVAVYDAEGNMRDMTSILADVESATEGMSGAQKDAALSAIFGDEAMRGLNIVMESGTDKVKNLESELRNSSGTAKTMAETMEGGLGGAFRSLASAASGALITIGGILAPFVTTAVTSLTSLLTKFNELDPAMQSIAVAAAAIAAGVGPALIIFGRLLPVLTRLFSIKTALVGVMGMVKGAFLFLTGPIGLTVAAILGLIAVFTYLWNTNEQFRTKVMAVWSAVQAFISTAISTVSSVVMSIWGAMVAWWGANQQSILTGAQGIWQSVYTTVSAIVSSVVSFVMQLWGQLVAFWSTHGQNLMTVTSTIFNTILAVVSAVAPLIKTVIQFAFQAIVFIVKAVWQNIQGVISGALNVILGLVGLFAAVFTGDFGAMWSAVKQIFSGAVQFLWNAVQLLLWGRLIKGVVAFAGLFRAGISSMWQSIQSLFFTSIYRVQNVFSSGFNALRSIATGFQNAFMAIIRTTWNIVRSIFTSGISIVRSVFSAGFRAIGSVASSIMNGIGNVIRMGWSLIRSVFTTGVNVVRSVFTAGFNLIRSVATTIMSGIGNVIRAGWNLIRNIFTTTISAIRNVVSSGFRAILNLTTTIFRAVYNAIRSALSSAKSFISSTLSAIRSTFDRILNGISSAVRAGFNKVKTIMGDGIRGAYDKVVSFLSKFREAGKNIVESIASGIRNAVGAVTDAIGNVTEKVRDFLPFSPAKEGALRDIMKVNIAGSLAETIDKGAKAPLKAMSSLTGSLQKEIEHASEASSDAFNPSLLMPDVRTPNVVNGLTGEYAKKMQQITAGAQVMAGGPNINANHNYDAQVQVNVQGNVDRDGITFAVNQSNGVDDSMRRGFDY
ncbi:phage tail tape measure protein [Salinicoccus roseus]|uniref:phage tail tape measure protein n=1 Tax=Salinicoccus roseus TaxID=45670 RepID=UPI001CA79E7A|nr:phage tail tape measure protein [Salinicoccus roseus]MBY8908213.1 phage tail tape measure protein [Salinicoccus roseus]